MSSIRNPNKLGNSLSRLKPAHPTRVMENSFTNPVDIGRLSQHKRKRLSPMSRVGSAHQNRSSISVGLALPTKTIGKKGTATVCLTTATPKTHEIIHPSNYPGSRFQPAWRPAILSSNIPLLSFDFHDLSPLSPLRLTHRFL